MLHRFNCLSTLAVAAALLAGAPVHAAELGDIAVRTYLNQPLTADIELVMLTPDEAAEGVPVRMAAANIYQGANVRMHPALAGARMSVQRKDQRLFVHIVTVQPVDTEVVHLYLELGTGSRAVVRAATLWLTPEPPGAPRPPVVRPVPVASAPEPAPLPPPVARAPVEARLPVAPLPPPAEAPPAALAHSSPATVTSDPALPGFAPSEAALIAARARASAEREALMRRAAYGSDLLRAAPQHSSPGRAACVPGGRGETAKQCIALDQKNTELNAKIRDLEGKVHALQTAMGGAAPVAAPATGVAPVAAHAASAASGVAAASAAPGASVAVSGVSAASAASAVYGASAVSGASAASAASAVSGASAASAASAVSDASAASTASAQSAASLASAPAGAAASAPMNPAGAVIPPTNGHGSNGTNGKRRGGLNTTTQIVLGVVAALALLGALTYLVRKNKLKLPAKEKLMFWKRWKRNKEDAADAPPAEQEPVVGKEEE